LFRSIQTRIEFKILLLLIAVLISGFGTYVFLTIQQESEALLVQMREKLHLFSESVSAGIRNVMLTGKSPYAVSFVNDTRENLPFASVTIYDRFGREVFLREGEGIVHNVQDELLNKTLEQRVMHSTSTQAGKGTVYARYEPLLNRQECWRCHSPQDPVRGVMLLGLRPDAIRTTKGEAASVRELAGTMGQFVATAFRTIMLGGQGEMMDTLTASAGDIPGIRRVQIYAKDGWLAFGPEEEELMDEDILPIVAKQSADLIFQNRGKDLRLFLPLVNEDRCQVCHGSRHPMRGVMVVDFDREALERTVRNGHESTTAALQSTVFEGFRSIMLVGRASSARYYIDAIRANPHVGTVRVFDKDKNERFLNPPLRERSQIAGLVSSKEPVEFVEKVGETEYMVRLAALPNEVRCYSCHGKNHEVRGIVEVSASMTAINDAIADNKLRSATIGALTILLVWVVLRQFMKSVVVNPVQAIEKVASKVGAGDFTVLAPVGSRDEIGSLAMRINEMVQGLRERFHLQKFVSEQTVRAVRAADQSGVRLGGQRKRATVFFSDIRGFTSFAEKNEPEKVVGMLNECLSTQASIVRKYGGDIDKYVGDELVAIFEGDNMVENALKAAREIQQVIAGGGDAAAQAGLELGIGINTGDMVMGAMGSKDRMDYTVIGDSVNLGARLCSAAKPGQVLLSEFSVNAMAGNAEFKLLPLEPLIVKGKQDPVRVYELEWSRSSKP
jgi:adenylate cyclase